MLHHRAVNIRRRLVGMAGPEGSAGSVSAAEVSGARSKRVADGGFELGVSRTSGVV